MQAACHHVVNEPQKFAINAVQRFTIVRADYTSLVLK